MIKKKLGMFIAPVLVLGLAACNNNDETAYNNQNRNGNTLNNTARNGDENLYRVNYRYPFDHQGPLSENYNNDNRRVNNRNITNVNDTNNFRRNVNDTNNFRRNVNDTNNFRRNVNDTNNFRRNVNNTVNDHIKNPNISSYRTSKTSNSYPHTRAVLIQEARYKFIPINPGQDSDMQRQLRQQFEIAKAPEQQVQPPAQQQPAPQQQTQPPAQQPVPQQQQQPKQQAPAPQQPAKQTAPANISQAAQQVIDLTNTERKKNGLPPLQADPQLSGVAQKKSDDMQQKGYFSHTSPTYGSPFDMMRDFGVTYRSAGENIAQGQRTPQEVVQAWMNSEGHRKNILSRDFTHIGVGFESAGNHWTQMFIGK